MSGFSYSTASTAQLCIVAEFQKLHFRGTVSHQPLSWQILGTTCNSVTYHLSHDLYMCARNHIFVIRPSIKVCATLHIRNRDGLMSSCGSCMGIFHSKIDSYISCLHLSKAHGTELAKLMHVNYAAASDDRRTYTYRLVQKPPRDWQAMQTS